jgi:hypothetical protein
MVARITNIPSHDAAAAQGVQHQGILLDANRGMGLIPPKRVALSPPNLGILCDSRKSIDKSGDRDTTCTANMAQVSNDAPVSDQGCRKSN